jgi:hypothetical protein
VRDAWAWPFIAFWVLIAAAPIVAVFNMMRRQRPREPEPCEHNFAFDDVRRGQGSGEIRWHCVKCGEPRTHPFSTGPYARKKPTTGKGTEK